ncbi:MAG: phospho-N-acetylmuramoyl-pentapeptide-transferase [Spirochaetae bacterium HGW-Spirochaetae-1]|jgi:phospho-N-acetylmuramoyl-pentapeptide-transferase|nr:MAG: phospho-N-acetylmuramoyl-pentapeptide-transferase [Spirochaetae bacterium HGW-Spirochaetae-1]
MFYHFILPLQEFVSFLRLFQYITFRSAYAAVTALVLVLLLGNVMIQWLQRLKLKEEIRELGPQSHQAKAGTPTMGGIIILGAVTVSILLWGNFTNRYLLLLIFATVALGALGFADDYIKAVMKKKDGLPPRGKLFVQFVVALIVSLSIYFFPSNPAHTSTLFVPFVNEAIFDLGWIWVVFSVIVIIGYSNAVNLTDGLDGLATGSVAIVVVVLAIMTYITGHVKIAAYLRIPYISDGAELTVFLSALAGALLGFLWFNSNPASVFMGDTGSLALGGVIGIVAVMIKKEFFLVIVGGVFVLEALSVVIQVGSFKLRKKRVFKMAPIHHHFELSGWPEQKVVVRIWILGIILAILGLSSLKIL